MKKTTSILAIAGLVLALAPATQAADIEVGDPLVPGGLVVDDTFQLVFVSSTTRDATSNDAEDYDAHVQSAANATSGNTLDLSGYTWKAFASTNDPLYHFRNNVSVAEAVYLVNGTKVASAGAFLSQTHDAAMNIDENGGTYNGSVWTGTSWEGWRNNSGLGTLGGFGGPPLQSDAGLSDQTDSTWAQGASVPVQTTLLPFYAVSEVLTVVESSTEPSTLAITSITVDGGTATIIMKGTDGTDYACMSSTTLDDGFPTTETADPFDPDPITTTEGTATFTVDASEAKKFYVVEEVVAE